MGRDIHERRRYEDKEDPNPASKYRHWKASISDWQTRRTVNANRGAWYRHKFGEELYKRLYERTVKNAKT